MTDGMVDDKGKIEALTGLVKFLTNHYLTSDVTWNRGWVCGRVREVEEKVGIQFIPPPMTAEERKEAGKQFVSAIHSGLYGE